MEWGSPYNGKSSLLERLAVETTPSPPATGLSPPTPVTRMSSPFSKSRMESQPQRSASRLPSLGLSPDSSGASPEAGLAQRASPSSALKDATRGANSFGEDFVLQIATELQLLNGQNETLITENTALSAELTHLRRELEKVAAHQSILVKTLSDVTEEMHRERDAKERLSGRLEAASHELEAVRSSVQVAERDAEESKKRVATMSAERSAVDAKVFLLEEVKCALQEAQQTAASNRNQFETEVAKREKECDAACQERDVMKAKCAEMETQSLKWKSRFEVSAAKAKEFEQATNKTLDSLKQQLHVSQGNASQQTDEIRRKLKRVATLEEQLAATKSALAAEKDALRRAEDRTGAIIHDIQLTAAVWSEQAKSIRPHLPDAPPSVDPSANPRELLKFLTKGISYLAQRQQALEAQNRSIDKARGDDEMQSHKLRGMVSAAQGRCLELESNVSALETSLAGLRCELAASEAARVKSETDSEALTTELCVCKAQEKRRTDLIASEHFAFDELRCQLGAAEDRASKAENGLQTLAAHNKALQGRVDDEMKRHAMEAASSQQTINALEKRTEATLAELKDLKQGRLKAQKRTQSQTEECRKLKEELTARAEEVASLAARLHVAEQSLNYKANTIVELQKVASHRPTVASPLPAAASMNAPTLPIGMLLTALRRSLLRLARTTGCTGALQAIPATRVDTAPFTVEDAEEWIGAVEDMFCALQCNVTLLKSATSKALVAAGTSSTTATDVDSASQFLLDEKCAIRRAAQAGADSSPDPVNSKPFGCEPQQWLAVAPRARAAPCPSSFKPQATEQRFTSPRDMSSPSSDIVRRALSLATSAGGSGRRFTVAVQHSPAPRR